MSAPPTCSLGCAGALGMYLGLTGARLSAADCLWTGIGSCYVPSERLEEVEARLAEADLTVDAHGRVQSVLDDLRARPRAATARWADGPDRLLLRP